MVRSLCLVVIVCLLAAGASAHGGTLHPSGPEQNNYIRAKVASCSKWAPASGTLKDSKVQPSAAKLAPVDVKGTAILWQYLYGNCSVAAGVDPSAGAVFNVSITRDGKPLSGVTLNGLGMTGSCASGGEKPFFFNPDRVPADHAENLLWFHNYTTKADGKVAGNGANDGLIRTVTQGNKEAVKSMVLVDLKTNAILSCCDLEPAGPASTNWTKSIAGKGKVCEEEKHGAHTPKTPVAAIRNATANATGDDDHAGHDHAGHDHSNGTKASPAPAAKARSAAAVASAGVVGAAAAALVMLLL